MLCINVHRFRHCDVHCDSAIDIILCYAHSYRTVTINECLEMPTKTPKPYEVAIDLVWARPVAGYVIVYPTEEEIQRLLEREKATRHLSSLERQAIAPTSDQAQFDAWKQASEAYELSSMLPDVLLAGPYIVARSSEFERCSPLIEVNHASQLLAEFVNAKDTASMFDFCNRFGVPWSCYAPSTDRNNRRSPEPMLLAALEETRQLMAECIMLANHERYDEYISWVFDNGWTDTSANIGLRRFPNIEKPRLVIQPSTLQSALWLILMQQIAGNVEFRTCSHCGILFAVGGDTGSHLRKQTCSPRCHTAAHRARKRIADAKSKRP